MSTFPVPDWIHTFSISAPPRSFGSQRSQGRRHAGCDLYAPIGSKVRAISKGVVLSKYPFFWGTSAVEVAHPGLGIVRYCEINVAPGIGANVEVDEGRAIGFVAQLVNPNPGGANPHPMLHLEWYSGSASGPLTTTDSPYKRRSDLRDPTGMLGLLWTNS